MDTTLLSCVACNDLVCVTRAGMRARKKPGTGAMQTPQSWWRMVLLRHHTLQLRELRCQCMPLSPCSCKLCCVGAVADRNFTHQCPVLLTRLTETRQTQKSGRCPDVVPGSCTHNGTGHHEISNNNIPCLQCSRSTAPAVDVPDAGDFLRPPRPGSQQEEAPVAAMSPLRPGKPGPLAYVRSHLLWSAQHP